MDTFHATRMSSHPGEVKPGATRSPVVGLQVRIDGICGAPGDVAHDHPILVFFFVWKYGLVTSSKA